MDSNWPPAVRADKAVTAYLNQKQTPAQQRLHEVIQRIPQKMTLAQKKQRFTEVYGFEPYQRQFRDFSIGMLSGVTWARIAEEYKTTANRALRVMKKLPATATMRRRSDKPDDQWFLARLGERSATTDGHAAVYIPGAFPAWVAHDQYLVADLGRILPGPPPRASLVCYPDDVKTLIAKLDVADVANIKLDFNGYTGQTDRTCLVNAAYLGLAFRVFNGPFRLLFWTPHIMLIAVPVEFVAEQYTSAVLEQGATTFMGIMPMRDDG